jgi:hypothetical protein
MPSPTDVNYGFYQDQTLKPYDPNDYIAAMQQGNPWFNPAYPTFDAVGGLSATMKSIKAMQLQNEMAAENKRRYDEEAKRRQQALDTNISRSNENSLPARQAQGVAILGENADPQDIARFTDTSYGHEPSAEEQLQSTIEYLMKTIPGIDPRDAAEMALKVGRYGYGAYASSQKAGMTPAQVQIYDREYKRLKAAGYTDEEIDIRMRDFAPNAGKTIAAEEKVESKNDYDLAFKTVDKLNQAGKYFAAEHDKLIVAGMAPEDYPAEVTVKMERMKAQNARVVALADRLSKWLGESPNRGQEFIIKGLYKKFWTQILALDESKYGSKDFGLALTNLEKAVEAAMKETGLASAPPKTSGSPAPEPVKK